ncbi:MAG TPA: hypothetical protein VFA75_01045 [Nevskia sp.]|nr:hypothetical protein [Nevskia sp.]
MNTPSSYKYHPGGRGEGPVAEGIRNPDDAGAGSFRRGHRRRLRLGAKTVANLQSAIRQKLGAANTAQLVRVAARAGIAVFG